MPRKRLGESLREHGKISKQALEKAIQEQAGTAILLGELLLSRGLISKADLILSLEEVARTPYVDPSSIRGGHASRPTHEDRFRRNRT